ncbi:MAG TPA: hypothetical protein VFG53_05510, partial [Anaeromyxobacter sp.]|nr:hypothetical protein [Anaeromyxobacter sp.]
MCGESSGLDLERAARYHVPVPDLPRRRDPGPRVARLARGEARGGPAPDRPSAPAGPEAPRAAEAYPRIEVSSRAAWRAWLERHHATSPGVWAVTRKKAAGSRPVSMADLSEEALCFG